MLMQITNILHPEEARRAVSKDAICFCSMLFQKEFAQAYCVLRDAASQLLKMKGVEIGIKGASHAG
jgi:hypothetical protein